MTDLSVWSLPHQCLSVLGDGDLSRIVMIYKNFEIFFCFNITKMGFFNRVSNWLNTTGAKIYNGVRQGLSSGYNAVSGVAHKIGTIADGVDNALTEIRKVPVIGQAAAALQNHPYYQEAKGLIKSGVGYVDQAGQIGRDVLKPIDKVVTDTVFAGNPNIKPLGT